MIFMGTKDKGIDRGRATSLADGFKQTSLRPKATMIAIALSVLPLLGVGIVEFLHDNQRLKDKLVSQQEAKTTLLADGLSRFMFDRYGVAQVIANLEILNTPQVAAQIPLRQKQDDLNRFMKAFGVYDNITFADTAGRVVVEVGVHAADNISDTPYFKEALRAKAPVITRPEKAKVTGLNSIVVSAPVVEPTTGRTIGVVATRMPVNRIDEFFLQGNPSLKQGQHIFMDGNGVIFEATKKEEVGQAATKLFPGLVSTTAAHLLSTVETPDLSDHSQQLVSYAPLPSITGGPDLKWSILLAQPATVLQAARMRLVLVYLGAIGLTAIAVGTIAALLVRRATTPILQAAGVVQRLNQGDLETRLDLKGNDELAVLGLNINQMADRLQALVRSQQSGFIAVEDLRQSLVQIEQTAIRTSESVDRDQEIVRQLADYAHEQTTHINRVLGCIEQVVRSLQLMASQAHSSDLVQAASTTTAAGKLATERTAQHLLTLRETIAEATHKAKLEGEFSQQISTAVSFVEDIAHRTNLLALNSSLMASRAEHQEGMATVAKELNEMSARSNAIIQHLQETVNNLQRERGEVSVALDASVTQVVESTHSIKETQQSLEKMLDMSHQIDEFIQFIMKSTESQSQTTQEMMSLMTEFAKIPEQTSHYMVQVSRSLEKTATVVQELQDSIQAFKLNAKIEG
jgi:methyl-accepting chemotaxis protein PixJ